MVKPASVAIRMYQVGFGDCFLVSFRYDEPLDDGRAERHMLVDFGSTHGPEHTRKPIVEQAAALLREHTRGQLDVVVMTHRHRDHLSGFGDQDSAAVIEALAPKLVVRPWTDHPDLPRDAEAPLVEVDGDDLDRRFAMNLAAGHRLAARIEELTAEARADSAMGQLSRLALDQVPNRKAIAFLDDLAARTGGGEYLSEGMPTKIVEHIPGITVRVLGPPTIAQHRDITRSRADDPDEFWLTQLGELHGLEPSTLAAGHSDPIPLGPVAWVVERLQRQRLASLQRIVRTVDNSLNNTSLILLVDAGDKRMLFPGDAQIENWSWALGKRRYRELLSRVDLYKVGHHGSRNATPKSLFRLWRDTRHEMVALMSTMPGVHGKSEATRVPRDSLVEALGQRMSLVRTDELDAEQGSVTVSAPCRGGRFTVSAG